MNGNLVRKTEGSRVTDFAYDSANRLASVALPSGGTASYAYDALGRRIRKDVDGSVTYYLYSDEGLVGEYDADGAPVKSYGWRPGGIWGTDPVFMKYDGNYYFYHNDRLGTPQEMTDMAAETVWRADYEAFGRAHITVDTLENNLRLPGQYYDEETGLHYNFHRYYDPETGRYVSEDPIGFAGGDANLYGYVRNQPTLLTDPFGLDSCVGGCHSDITYPSPSPTTPSPSPTEPVITSPRIPPSPRTREQCLATAHIEYEYCARGISRSYDGCQKPDDNCFTQFQDRLDECLSNAE